MVTGENSFPGGENILAVHRPAEVFRQHFKSVDFSVAPGTTLLVFRRRELVQTWQPGTHQWPKSLWETFTGFLVGAQPPISGWWVRTVPVEAGPISLSGLFSSDELPFVASVAFTVQAQDAVRLVTSLGWGKDAIAAADIAALLSPHVEAVLEASVRQLSAAQLADASQREPLTYALLEAARPVLQERGILLTGMARPLTLACPRIQEGQRIRQEYQAFLTKEQATAEGKRALADLLASQEADEIRRAAQHAEAQESKARVFQRVQAIVVQMAQDEALTGQKLEEIRRQADRARTLADDDWGRFILDLDAAKSKDGYGKQATVEVARLESEYAIKEARLRLEDRYTTASQESLRRQHEADLQWRIQQARLEEQAVTARLEEQEHRKTIAALEEARRQAESQRLQQDSKVAAKGVVRIANADNETTEISEPVGVLEISNSDHIVLRLKSFVERITVSNSDNVHIIAERGYGALERNNSDGVRITVPSPEEVESEKRRRQQELRALEEELRRQQEAAEGAHHRRQQLEEEKARLERQRLQTFHDLEVEQQRARQEDERRSRVQDTEAQRKAREFREIATIIQESVAQYPAMPKGLAVMPAVMAYPEHKDALMKIVEFLYAPELSAGKIALLRGQRDEFISWVGEHYGALGKALDAGKGTIKSVDDLLRVVDGFLREGPVSASDAVLRITDWQAMLPQLQPSVVLLHTPIGFGTGFVVKAGQEPVIATSAHLFGELQDDKGKWNVVPNCQAGVAYIAGSAFPLCLFLWKTAYDLALLRPMAGYHIALPALDVSEAPVGAGENIAVLGFPLSADQPLRQSTARFSPGAVAGSWLGAFPFPLMHLTAPVNFGNSGGPVFNGQGKVVGVVSHQIPNAQGMSFAVPGTMLKEVIKNAPSLLAKSPTWQAELHAGVLVLRSAVGGWQVDSPATSWEPLTLTQAGRGVTVKVFMVRGANAIEALSEGLAALGNPMTDEKRQPAALSAVPYWEEIRLSTPEAVALLRWDPALGRGVLALAQPTAVTTSGDWQDYATMMMRYLYPE